MDKSVEKAVDDARSTNNSRLLCELIKSVVLTYHNLPASILKGKGRKREIVMAKQTIAYLIKHFLPKSTLKYVGEQTCGYDHATVLYSIRNIKNLIDTDAETKKDITELIKIVHIRRSGGELEKGAESGFYYIDINDCHSIKLPNGKCVIFGGFTNEEAQEFSETYLQNTTPVEHNNTGLFILEKLKPTE